MEGVVPKADPIDTESPKGAELGGSIAARSSLLNVVAVSHESTQVA